MRNTLRTCIVGLLVVMMTINPAWACHYCGGGGWHGGYYQYRGPVYYSGCGGGGSSCCGGGYVVVDDCDSCQPCGGCGSMRNSRDGKRSGKGIARTNACRAGRTGTADERKTGRRRPTPQQPAHVDRPVENTPAPRIANATPARRSAAMMNALPTNEPTPPMPPRKAIYLIRRHRCHPSQRAEQPAERRCERPRPHRQRRPTTCSAHHAAEPAAPAEKPGGSASDHAAGRAAGHAACRHRRPVRYASDTRRNRRQHQPSSSGCTRSHAGCTSCRGKERGKEGRRHFRQLRRRAERSRRPGER